MPFREDILRGVRLFAIAFAGILGCVAAYRMLRVPSAPVAASQAEPPAAEPTPVPVVVPEPPPVAGKSRRVADPGVPPPPPVGGVARSRKGVAPEKEAEAVNPTSAPVEVSSEAKPLTPKQAVGYKSLMEATANRPPDPTAVPIEEETVAKARKGNRFLRALGRIFHPGGKQ